jgi:hypothetical protein
MEYSKEMVEVDITRLQTKIGFVRDLRNYPTICISQLTNMGIPVCLQKTHFGEPIKIESNSKFNKFGYNMVYSIDDVLNSIRTDSFKDDYYSWLVNQWSKPSNRSESGEEGTNRLLRSLGIPTKPL